MARKYLIIPVSEVSKVDFSQVCETSCGGSALQRLPHVRPGSAK